MYMVWNLSEIRQLVLLNYPFSINHFLPSLISKVSKGECDVGVGVCVCFRVVDMLNSFIKCSRSTKVPSGVYAQTVAAAFNGFLCLSVTSAYFCVCRRRRADKQVHAYEAFMTIFAYLMRTQCRLIQQQQHKINKTRKNLKSSRRLHRTQI